MALSERDRTRFARHLLLSQLGEAGQERLLAASVQVDATADAGACAVARTYLERAGLTVQPDDAAGPRLHTHALTLASSSEVARIAGSTPLLEATRALLGALAAVQVIQHVTDQPAAPFSSLSFAISSEDA